MEYGIKRVEDGEKIDWSAIERVTLVHQKWLTPCDVAATAQACYDDAALYVRMEAVERDIRCEGAGPLAPVWEDSCLEFFFAPLAADARYFNLEWNPAGALCFGFGPDRTARMRQVPQSVERVFAPQPFETQTGWGICFRVPLALIHLYFPEFAFGGVCAGNFYKCGDKTKTPHFLAWAALGSERPDFHRRGDFGTLRFE